VSVHVVCCDVDGDGDADANTTDAVDRTEAAAPVGGEHSRKVQPVGEGEGEGEGEGAASALSSAAAAAAAPRRRNFEFRTMSFAEAVARCAGGVPPLGEADEPARAGGGTSEGDEEEGEGRLAAGKLKPLLGVGERYYLRSVGVEPRRDAADFPSLFPDLATECHFLPSPRSGRHAAGEAVEAAAAPGEPDGGDNGAGADGAGNGLGGGLISGAQYHSSVLRLASDDTQLWTHFDVMDNVLAQLTGQKRVVLWPPDQDENLYVAGSTSCVEDIDRWHDEAYPRWRLAVPRRSECLLEPGDVLFIPALWFHNVTSIGFSVALNVFFRGWHHHTGAAAAAARDLYELKDLYGNKDPPAAARAITGATAAAAELERLPEPFRSFYGRRAIREIAAALRPPAKAHTP
jgi:hypothetical protein